MGGALGHFFWGSRSTLQERNSSPIPTGEPNPPPVLSTMAGASTSEPTDVRPIAKLNEVNDSVWEFYDPGDDTEAEIIFFHGLQVQGDYKEAYWKTWLSTDGTVVWPREWLNLKCPKARTLSVSYDSSATLQEGHLDMYLWGENLVEDIIHSANCGQEPGRPVILVGHCLGGIMIKQFINSAINSRSKKAAGSQAAERIDNFLRNFKGAFFYATPNGGSPEIQKWAEKLQNRNPLLDLLKVLSTETQRINNDFRQHRENFKVKTYAICEMNPTKSYGFNAVVVREASARQDIDDYYSYSGSDHFRVCRARNNLDSTVIGKLSQFTKDIIDAEKQAKMERDFRKFEELKRQALARAGVNTRSNTPSRPN